MFRISMLFFICLFGYCSQTFANTTAQLQVINCAPQVQPYLLKILKVSEIRNLIAMIQQEGLIDIEINHNQLSEQFGAFWDVDQRTICVNLSSIQTEGEVIGSILFELQNAAANSKIQALDQAAKARTITRDQYVESMEYIEYENSLKAASLAKKGIAQGIFPKDACLPTYKDFNEHFYYQKMSGHSAWFAKNYDAISHRR